MTELIKVDLEKLVKGDVFGEKELIIFSEPLSANKGRLETVKKEEDSEHITCTVYDIDRRKGTIKYKGESEIVPDESEYEEYKSQLEAVGRWHGI